MSDDFDIDEIAPPAPPAPKASPKPALPVTPVAPPVLQGVNGQADELNLVSCLLSDPDLAVQARGLSPEAFTNTEARAVWSSLTLGGYRMPDDLFKIAKASKTTNARLFELQHLVPTSAGFSAYLQHVEEKHRDRRFYELAQEMAKSANPDPAHWQKKLEELSHTRTRLVGLPPSAFKVPLPGDPSILLGNRYLVRGDGAILVSTSGMGKSSMLILMAYLWALAMDFFGVKPNGPLRVLIVQSEDSEGDIAEVCVSIQIMLKLTPEQIALVDERVLIITDRIHRGPAFVTELGGHVRTFKPDLVMLNPLKAFFKGDLNSGEDAGDFLREGLNGLNTPGRFAYLIVHHAAKPPNSKDTKERKWSEVMYDMTGSAELTDWSRAVISLRATEQEGEFNLVFAKRGRRAGATVITGAADQFEEIGTSIPIKHTKEMITPPGHTEAIPAIFWERRPLSDEEKEAKKVSKGGRPKKHHFDKFAPAFPTEAGKALGINALMREIVSKGFGAISKGALDKLIDDAVEERILIRISRDDPRYYIAPKQP